MLKKIILLAMMAMLVVGCNTVRGVGKDVKAGGEVIQDAATPDRH